MQARKLHQAIRLLYVRQLRLPRDRKAKPILLEQIIGNDNKGWAARNIDALKERVFLLEADGAYAAVQEANKLVKGLIKKADTDNVLKEQYLECYYHVVYCFLKHGQNQTDAAKRAKFIKDAATQILALEKPLGQLRHRGVAKTFQGTAGQGTGAERSLRRPQERSRALRRQPAANPGPASHRQQTTRA